MDRTRINHNIKAREVRLISDDKKQLGVVKLSQALEMANEQDLDLVEVAAKVKPPVCRIMDYGKYRYEQTKRSKEAKSHSHKTKTKEIKFRPNVGEHDYDYKKNHVIKFLKKGDRVKVICYYRGRENAHKELGVKLINKLIKEVEEFGAIDIPPKRMGATFSVVLGPIKSK